MTDLEAEDAQTIHPPSRQPGCRCPDPGRACGCDDDGTTAEPREWIHAEKPETTCHVVRPATFYVAVEAGIRTPIPKRQTPLAGVSESEPRPLGIARRHISGEPQR